VLFNSYAFVGFLVAAAVLFHAAPLRVRSWIVLVVSYAYILSFGAIPAAVLLASTLVAWWAARRIRSTPDGDRARIRNLAVAVVALLGALSLFKYGRALSGGALSIAAPVGISYYTFKLISYVVDTYWEKVETEHDALAVLRYAAFFPQILSGPIQRAEDFFRQEKAPVAAEVPMIAAGLQLLLFGFFKKLVVADRAALLVDQVYARPHAHPAELLFVTPYVYAIQLYADFSGFTDMAIGAGCVFGVKGPPNFDNPYYASNIQEFWRRWHMSLSSWLGDYLFTPLRMALRNFGNGGLVLAIAINMIAIGVWHGPSLTFVAFGVINAVYMSVSALTLARRNKWFKKRPQLARARRIIGAVVVFQLMVIAFIPFRAESVTDAWFVFLQMVRGAPGAIGTLAHPGVLFRTLEGWNMQHLGIFIVGTVVMETVHIARARDRAPSFADRPIWQRWGAYYALFVATAIFGMARSSTFIYFKF
jgi:D-alanyl-lipoteichoic acid acyltransferase DltB (MBOAT superfamily)